MNWYTKLAAKLPPTVDNPEEYLIAKRLLTSNREFMYIPGSKCLITGDKYEMEVDCANHMSEGGWSVHNHPGGIAAIPSLDDLLVAGENKQSRMDIVATNSGAVLIMESPNGKWPVPRTQRDMNNLYGLLTDAGIKFRHTTTQKYQFTKAYYVKRQQDREAKRLLQPPVPAQPKPAKPVDPQMALFPESTSPETRPE